jgi:3-hydroxyisobutyrate dehydrogenase
LGTRRLKQNTALPDIHFDTAMQHIGFIGLGMMGRPMAHRLHQAGFGLAVHDANPQTEAAFLNDHPGTVAAVGAETCAERDAIVTMLPNSDAVEEALSRVTPHLQPGTVVIDMSSSDPNRTRELARRLAGREIVLIDAPVSGGVKKAAAGTLAIMVGGDAAAHERSRKLLEAMGSNITHVGPSGAGHALKALNNYVSLAGLIATAEAVHVGQAFGIAPATVVDVINASTGRNNTTENKAHQYMLSRTFDSGFSLALAAKDVGIAAALGPSLGQPMVLAQQVQRMASDASSRLGPNADHTELFRYLEKD